MLLVALIGFSSQSIAKDLGVIGPTYSILERDLVELIRERLTEKTASGEVARLNEELRNRGRNYAAKPPGSKLPRAVEYSATQIDPVYTLDRDITDASGKILFFRGTKVNPLEIKPLTKTLCFIDGYDKEQVEWMQRFCAANKRNKLILVDGDYLALAEKTKLRLYFDQRGYLINRFGITALPAVVRQSGSSLYVETFHVN